MVQRFIYYIFMARQIRIDDETYEFLLDRAQPGESSAQTVRRVLEQLNATLPPRKQRSLASERRKDIYRDAILSLLFDHGGEVRIADFKNDLLRSVKPKLTQTEITGTKSNRPVWWFDAEAERAEMVQDGLIDGSNPRGYWKLTRQGSKVAKTLD